MSRFQSYFVLFVAAALGVVAGHARPALGDDFRVDNVVFAGDQKEPTSQSTTIFHGGVVYDCLKTPDETVIFDTTTGRFNLLNAAHQARAELTTKEIASLIDRLQPLAAKSKDPLVKFLAEPKFQERFDEAAGELTLSSPWITYRLTLAPEADAKVVEQYHEFCDWYARLNALLAPGSLPPFGRLVVNAALAKRQATASKIVLTVMSGKGVKQQTTIRSEHRLVRPLDPADIEQVARVRESASRFKVVSFDQYRKIAPR